MYKRISYVLSYLEIFRTNFCTHFSFPAILLHFILTKLQSHRQAAQRLTKGHRELDTSARQGSGEIYMLRQQKHFWGPHCPIILQADTFIWAKLLGRGASHSAAPKPAVRTATATTPADTFMLQCAL